jgi:hypothetical protein
VKEGLRLIFSSLALMEKKSKIRPANKKNTPLNKLFTCQDKKDTDKNEKLRNEPVTLLEGLFPDKNINNKKR